MQGSGESPGVAPCSLPRQQRSAASFCPRHLLRAGSFLDEERCLEDNRELLLPNLSLSFLVLFSSFLPMSLFSHSGMSNSLQSHGLQHARHPLSFGISWSWPKLMSIVSVMPSNHLILPRSVDYFSLL